MANMKHWLILWLALGSLVRADDLTTLCADRAAVERVYYQHRLGTKPPFEQVMPPTLIEKLVDQDLHKEAVLKKVYGVEITPAMLAAEVQRINATTRAPDILAELKAALGNDTNRFALTVARPILVERILRDKFDNDDSLHALQRQQTDRIRTALLAAKQEHVGTDGLLNLFRQLGSNQVTATTWQLGKPPDQSQGGNKELTNVQQQFGPNAQIISPLRDADGKPTFYFDNLPQELQQVLRAQLHQPGDVSAVIETPGGFLLYLCKEKTLVVLGVATLSIPKQSYGKWLAAQTG
jgi:hypothetical protein